MCTLMKIRLNMFEIHQLWSRLWYPNVLGETGHGFIAPLGTDVGQVWVLVTSWAPRGHWIGCREVGKSGVFRFFKGFSRFSLVQLGLRIIQYLAYLGHESFMPLALETLIFELAWNLCRHTSRFGFVRKPEVSPSGAEYPVWSMFEHFGFVVLGAKVVSSILQVCSPLEFLHLGKIHEIPLGVSNMSIVRDPQIP